MSYKPQRTFNGTQGNPSTDTMGPEQLSHDIDELCKMFNPNSVHSDGSAGGVTPDNMSFTADDINDIGGVASSDIKAVRKNTNGDLEYSTDGVNFYPAFAREANYLPFAGGTMTGTLNMNSQKVTNLPLPTDNAEPATKQYVDSADSNIDAALALKAPLESPVLTGTPTAPTAAAGTNTTQIATTAFTKAAVDTLGNVVYTKTEADTKYETIADANSLVKTITYAAGTGTFTITTQGGTVKTIDTDIEKIPVSVEIIASGGTYKLRITNEDGSYSECDISALFNATHFVDSSEIDFTETTNSDGSKNVTAGIKDGAITASKLDPDYRSDLTTLVTRAETAESNAQTYKDNAALSASAAAGSATTASGYASDALSYRNAASGYANDASGHASDASASATEASGYATDAGGSASDAETAALDAEAAARGTRNGVPVGSDDEFYHDNAEYYKDQAAAIVGPQQPKITATGILKGEGDGVVTSAASGTDYQAAITASGILKGNGSGSVTAATAGTDYQAPLPSQTSQSGKFLTTDGADLSWASVTQDDHKWNDVALDKTNGVGGSGFKIPVLPSSSSTTAYLLGSGCTPTAYYIAQYDSNKYLKSTTPSANDNSAKVATTAYVDSAVAGVDALPSQSGQSGKFLTTNGTTASWTSLPVYDGEVE